MSISASVFLVGFGALFLVLVVMAVIHVFHAWRFGEHTPLAAITSGIFFLGIMIIVGTIWTLLHEVDWSQTYTISLPAIPGVPADELNP